MSFKLTPPTIQKSVLIKQLQKKVAKSTLQFNFLGRLQDWAERISGDVQFVKLTFPEFTDHTSDIHFPNLFNLTTTLLGEKLLSSMYVEELFVLSAGLYGHDWGMAVSTGEKELILNGTCDNHTIDPLWLLPNEKQVLENFIQTYGISLNAQGYPGELPF